MWVPSVTRAYRSASCYSDGGERLRARELGDGLGALGHGVLGELAREHEADGRLDLAGRERRLLGEAAQLGGLEGDALEDVVDERVHDRHALLGDARVRVHLLEHLVDVRRVRLGARLLLLGAAGLLGGFRRLLGGGLGHVAGGVFYVDGVSKPTLNIIRGFTYIFDQANNTNNNHPIAFKDGSGNSYTTGVTVNGTAGQAGANVTFVVPANAPSALRYYCTVHGNAMGNTIAVGDDNIGVVASDIGNVNTVAGAITNVNNVGGSIANVNTVASNLSGVNSFAARYRTDNTGIGFSAEVNAANDKEVVKINIDNVEPEDLVKFGLIPEFVGRLPVISILHELDEDALVRILLEPKNALVNQYKYLFEIDSVDLSFREEALKSIAKRAIARKTGARGLRSILEDILMDVMFELLIEDLEKVIIDEMSADYGSEPIKVFKTPKKKSSAS